MCLVYVLEIKFQIEAETSGGGDAGKFNRRSHFSRREEAHFRVDVRHMALDDPEVTSFDSYAYFFNEALVEPLSRKVIV